MNPLEHQIVRVGTRRTSLRGQANEASRELAPLVREAVAGGMSKVRVAELAGLSRPALDKMLEVKPSP